MVPEKRPRRLERPLRGPRRHPESYCNTHGPTPGALQGDDYPIEMDANGYPELPACLDRRPKPAISEAA